ncbi:DMT family transporter [Peribacillus sp. TH16]|uniref:DMT family transporter n=1 Tax=unclassified Peribacillus TaxID=2675266 RepID=UPI001911C647|nr:DMT family transporter [Peribacillus sp. TH16]MBK5458140.1 DMT family transporter [Peribacillus sp. TH27]MBK5482785.1 DMT family transporter [Peribacillus sp. TH16]
MGEMLALLSMILFSANIILTKLAIARLNLNLGFLISVAVNVLFAFFLFFIQIIFFDAGDLAWHTKGFFLFLIAGFFGTYLGRWFFFETIAKLGPTRASAFQVTNPIFTTIIAWLFLKEQLSSRDLSSILLILFGLLLVSYIPQRSKNEIVKKRKVINFQPFPELSFKGLVQSGILVALLSSLAYAIGNVIRGAAILNWDQPILGGALGALLGFVLHVATSKSKRNFWRQFKEADITGVWLYVISGIITISAQISVIASMRYIPISVANLITLSTPILVTPVSYFLFKNQEGITYQTLIGIGLVLSGLVFIVL